jgi:hypothetical protein
VTRTSAPASYWVIGGKYVNAEYRHRRWSEVIGPLADLQEARAICSKMNDLYAHDGLVRFTLVQNAEAEAA